MKLLKNISRLHYIRLGYLKSKTKILLAGLEGHWQLSSTTTRAARETALNVSNEQGLVKFLQIYTVCLCKGVQGGQDL